MGSITTPILPSFSVYWLQTSRRFTSRSIAHSASRSAYRTHSEAIQRSRLFPANSAKGAAISISDLGSRIWDLVQLDLSGQISARQIRNPKSSRFFPPSNKILRRQGVVQLPRIFLGAGDLDVALERVLAVRAEVGEI